jgi:hypothetical protein
MEKNENGQNKANITMKNQETQVGISTYDPIQKLPII